MKSIKESKILAWGIFDPDYMNEYDHSIDVNYMRVPNTLIACGILIIPTIVLASFAASISPWLVIPVMMAAIYGLYKIPIVGRHHVLHGLTGNVRRRAEFYYSLDKDDRRLYPYNIEKIFHMDMSKLDPVQKRELMDKLAGLECDIMERKAAYDKIVEVKPDITAELEYLQDSRKGQKIAIKTYKEYT